MKKIAALTFFMSFSTLAEAASFKPVSNLRDGYIDGVASMFEVRGVPDVVVTTRVEYKFSGTSRSLVQTLKQLIHFSNASIDLSRADYVEVKPTGSSSAELIKAVDYALSPIYPVINEEEIEEMRTKMIGNLVEATEQARGLKMYLVSDGNKFGYCSRLALVDTVAQEIALVGSCDSEE